MRQIRDVLRYHFDLHLSRAAIAVALGMAKGSVSNLLTRFADAGLTWPLARP